MSVVVYDILEFILGAQQLIDPGHFEGGPDHPLPMRDDLIVSAGNIE